MDKKLRILISIIFFMMGVIMITVLGQTAQETVSSVQLPAKTELRGELILNMNLGDKENVFSLPAVDSVKNKTDLSIMRENDKIGSLSLFLDIPQLQDGKILAELRMNNEQKGQLSIDSDKTAGLVSISLQLSNLALSESSIQITNDDGFIAFLPSFDIVYNNQVIGSIQLTYFIETIADFSGDGLLNGNIVKQTDSTDTTLGQVNFDASKIEFEGLKVVINTFEGKITSITGEPVTDGFICIKMNDVIKNCVKIQKNVVDNSGEYAITIEGYDKALFLFEVNGINAGTKELNSALSQVKFDLQVDTSTVNFVDADKDGIPDSVDKCQNSVVSDVNTDGCDCSQKQCLIGSSCQFDFLKGIDCINAPVEKCSQLSSCLEKTKVPKFCNSDGIVQNDCQKCGCPDSFNCAPNGNCVKVLTDLIGTWCKDNDFAYSLSPIECEKGWIKEDIQKYLSFSIKAPSIIKSKVKHEVRKALNGVTLCLKTSDMGCAPRDKPYTCRFEALLDAKRGDAEKIMENTISTNMPSTSLQGVAKLGISVLTFGGTFSTKRIKITPHVNLADFKLGHNYDCAPKLVTSDIGCMQLINNGQSDKRVDIVFVGDGFLDDQSFIDTINEMVDYNGVYANTAKEGLFSIEPFKSAKTKFNIWAVNAKNSMRHEIWTADIDRGYMPVDEDVNEFSSYCSSKDYVIVISKLAFRSFCMFGGQGSCFVSVGDEPFKGRLLLHEFGHGFASLRDEYTQETPIFRDVDNRINLLENIAAYAYGPNCKANEGEAQQAWDNLISVDNKIGYFKSCGGDCMPACADAVRPTYLSIMNTYSLKADSQIFDRTNPSNNDLIDTFGPPFEPYYSVNEQEIKKQLDNYEAGDASQTIFWNDLSSASQTSIQTIRLQKIHDCAINRLCDLLAAPKINKTIDVDNLLEDLSKPIFMDAVILFGGSIPVSIQNLDANIIKMMPIDKEFSKVTLTDCQNELAKMPVSNSGDISGNMRTVCLQGNQGAIMKLGNSKITKTPKSTLQSNGDMLNQIIFDYTIDYELI